MNKHDFLKTLEQRLRFLSKDSASEAINYFDELISDTVEEQHISEQEAIDALGGIDTVIAQIVSQYYGEKDEANAISPSEFNPSLKWGRQRYESILDYNSISIKMHSRKVIIEPSEDKRTFLKYFNRHNGMYSFSYKDKILYIEEDEHLTYWNFISFFIQLCLIITGVLCAIYLDLVPALFINIGTILGCIAISGPVLISIRHDFLRLKIPASKLQMLNITSRAGAVIIKNTSTSDLNISSKSGKIYVKNTFCDNLQIKNNNGATIISNEKLLHSQNVDIICKNGKLFTSNISAEKLGLKSHNGRITVNKCQSNEFASLKNYNGKITINDSKFNIVDAQIHNGIIKLNNLSAEKFSATSKNGKIHSGSALDIVDSVFKSHNGAIKLHFFGKESDYNISLGKMERRVKINKNPTCLFAPVKESNAENTRSIIIIYNDAGAVKLKFDN